MDRHNPKPANDSTNHVDRLVGHRMTCVRKGAGFSVEDLTRAIGVPSSTIRGMESGRIRVGAATLLQVCLLFNVSPSMFYLPLDDAK